MVLDTASGKVTPLIETVRTEGFKGVNDLHFGANGDLYFTDQGQTGLHDPTGRVYRYHRRRPALAVSSTRSRAPTASCSIFTSASSTSP